MTDSKSIKMNFPAPTQEYKGFKYYLATKSFESRKWHFANKPFILSVTNDVMGEFITTMWYNQLCTGDDWGCEVAVVRMATGAKPEEFKAVRLIMDGLSTMGDGYSSYDGVVLHGIFDCTMYRISVANIVDKLNKNSDGAASVSCDLKMTTPGLIMMTVQGSYKENCGYLTTITLPVFEIKRSLM